MANLKIIGFGLCVAAMVMLQGCSSQRLAGNMCRCLSYSRKFDCSYQKGFRVRICTTCKMCTIVCDIPEGINIPEQGLMEEDSVPSTQPGCTHICISSKSFGYDKSNGNRIEQTCKKCTRTC